MKNGRIGGFGSFLGRAAAAVVLAGGLLSGVSGPVWAEEAGNYPELIPGESLKGWIDLSEEGVRYRTYRVSVPSTAYALRLSLEESPADLDLFIRHGEVIQNYDETDFESTKQDFNEELTVTRMTGEGLQSGVYYVDVVYQLEELPVVRGKQLEGIPFRLSLDIIRARVDQVLQPGRGVSSKLLPEKGMFRTFAVDVPAEAGTLRVDLYNAYYDLDLFISRKSPLLTRQNSLYTGETVMAWESLVLGGEGADPLEPGRYYITVVDQVSQALPEEFSLAVSFSAEPPAFLKEIPPLPEGDASVQGVLNATVQVIGGNGSGSGTLLSPDGLVLTNYHVVQGRSGESRPEVVVAVNISNDRPPRELFRARIIREDSEKDLALLEIQKGLYSQALPAGYTFPWVPLGDSRGLRIGEALYLAGYPWIGGTGSRVSVTYTEGIVAGFERTAQGILVKTDAEMNYGNSGGAALNGKMELVGVPSSVVNEDAGQLGYIRPVHLMPADWQRLIRERQP